MAPIMLGFFLKIMFSKHFWIVESDFWSNFLLIKIKSMTRIKICNTSNKASLFTCNDKIFDSKTSLYQGLI